MSTTEKIHSQELVMPVFADGGGLWVRQPAQHRDQQSSPDLAQHDHQMDHHPDQHCQQRPQQPQQQLTDNIKSDLFVLVNNTNLNSSSSDLTTPLTPTFSSHGGNHLRYASSTSSLDLQQSFSSVCSDGPVSPNQSPKAQSQIQNQAQAQSPANASPIAPASTKRPLPDVQEDPLERDDGDDHTLTNLTAEQLENLYDCLCMLSALDLSLVLYYLAVRLTVRK